MIAPVVFTPSSKPGLGPGVPRSSRSSSDAVGKARPITIVTGRTVSTAEPNSTPIETSGRPDRATRGCEITRIRPATLRIATANCDDREDPDRILDPRPERVEGRRPDGDADQEQREDDGEDVGQPAGPGREQRVQVTW